MGDDRVLSAVLRIEWREELGATDEMGYPLREGISDDWTERVSRLLDHADAMDVKERNLRESADVLCKIIEETKEESRALRTLLESATAENARLREAVYWLTPGCGRSRR